MQIGNNVCFSCSGNGFQSTCSSIIKYNFFYSHGNILYLLHWSMKLIKINTTEVSTTYAL